MKKRGRIFIIIIILIVVIDIIALIGSKIFKKEDKNQEEITTTENNNENQVISSNKIEENVKIEGLEELEVNGLDIKKGNNEFSIDGNINNTSEKEIEIGPVNVTLLDKDGNEVMQFVVYLDNIEGNGTVAFQAASTEDLSNVVSYTISK